MTDFNELRKKAERRMQESIPEPININEYTELEIQKLVHNLKVHQVELEMQNYELQQTQVLLEEARDKYLNLYDFAPVGYVTLDEKQKITQANNTFSDYLGCPKKYLIDKPFSKIIKRDNQDIFYLFMQGLKSSNINYACELQLERMDGSAFYVQLKANIDLENKKNYRLAITDISELKNIEKELIVAKEKAEENDKLKSMFLANMSHEIRTPMNGILGFANLLKSTKISGSKHQKFVDIIQQSGNRMLSIIDDLIDISQIEAGQTTINLAETNINQMMDSLFVFFKPEATAKGFKFTCNKILPEVESIIITDKTKLNQILSNLIKNAIKYTRTGSIDFGYTLENNHLRFYVKDTGIGVPYELQHRIFERFHQADNSLEKHIEGIGLGLAISKAYVEKLGGEIGVNSEPGKGSEFYFSIPYTVNIGGTLEQETIISKSEFSFEGITILVAEDDESSYILLDEMLSEVNATILHALNGKEAVEMCEQHPEIDLVLMDIKMKILDGYEATKQIKQFRPGLPIIAQTAYALSIEKQKALDMGCDDYIDKPIKRNEVFSKIERQLA